MKLSKLFAALLGALAVPAAMAGVYPQCPADVTALGTNSVDPATGLTLRSYTPPGGNRKVCLHVVAGDGWQVLGDGRQSYGFGFAAAQGNDEQVMINGTAAAKFPAPTLTFQEGDEVWLSLTNVGMIHRPDLFDQHSVHWHGYPQASAIFDGVPQASATVQMGSTFTYYYKVNDPGTFMWHCHVEATEHMEMGMLGMLNVLPRQNGSVAHQRRQDLHALRLQRRRRLDRLRPRVLAADGRGGLQLPRTARAGAAAALPRAEG